MNILATARNIIPAAARESWYRYGGALIVFLGTWGYLDAAEVQQWTTLVLATVTLLFAALHATSPWRLALYLALVAVQGVAGLYGMLDDQRWGAIVTLVAVALGVTTAAAKTTVIDGEVLNVTDTEIGTNRSTHPEITFHDPLAVALSQAQADRDRVRADPVSTPEARAAADAAVNEAAAAIQTRLRRGFDGSLTISKYRA